MQELLADFRLIVDEAYTKLAAISEERGSQPPAPGKWSRKQYLGHLIDSAANNHQRFVRAQSVEELRFPEYHQEEWVSVQQYDRRDWIELVLLWNSYNRHLMHIVAAIPGERLGHTCLIGGNPPVTLEFLVADYLRHMKHHLGQILS